MILIDFECSEVVSFQKLWAEFIVRSVSKVISFQNGGVSTGLERHQERVFYALVV